MLKVIGCVPSGRATVEIDTYVPLTVELGGSGPATPLFWRGRTEEGSLVEVGLSPIDGSLCSITLASISRERLVRGGLGYRVQAGEVGIPKIDLSLWPLQRREFVDNFVDELVPLQVLLGKSAVAVCFSPSSEPVAWQELDDIRFGVTEEGLFCYVEVRGLSEEQIATIAEAADG